MVISAQCTSSKDNKINKKHFISWNGHWLRRAPPFCFVSLLCNSLFQIASQLWTQLQSTTKHFLVRYRCIAKRYKALCKARLMQLIRNEPAHAKTDNKTCVTSKYSDQPVHPPSMARVIVHLFLDSLEAVHGTCNQQRLWSDCLSVAGRSEFSLVAKVLL